jgi:hypothetical protein
MELGSALAAGRRSDVSGEVVGRAAPGHNSVPAGGTLGDGCASGAGEKESPVLVLDSYAVLGGRADWAHFCQVLDVVEADGLSGFRFTVDNKVSGDRMSVHADIIDANLVRSTEYRGAKGSEGADAGDVGETLSLDTGLSRVADRDAGGAFGSADCHVVLIGQLGERPAPNHRNDLGRPVGRSVEEVCAGAGLNALVNAGVAWGAVGSDGQAAILVASADWTVQVAVADVFVVKLETIGAEGGRFVLVGQYAWVDHVDASSVTARLSSAAKDWVAVEPDASVVDVIDADAFDTLLIGCTGSAGRAVGPKTRVVGIWIGEGVLGVWTTAFEDGHVRSMTEVVGRVTVLVRPALVAEEASDTPVVVDSGASCAGASNVAECTRGADWTVCIHALVVDTNFPGAAVAVGVSGHHDCAGGHTGPVVAVFADGTVDWNGVGMFEVADVGECADVGPVDADFVGQGVPAVPAVRTANSCPWEGPLGTGSASCYLSLSG